jgi:hypothetical protein
MPTPPVPIPHWLFDQTSEPNGVIVPHTQSPRFRGALAPAISGAAASWRSVRESQYLPQLPSRLGGESHWHSPRCPEVNF